MKKPYVYPIPEFYARANAYEKEYGLDAGWKPDWEQEGAELTEVMGEARGGKALDCACGWGAQAIALAKLGWEVTATDISEANMALAREDARREGVEVDFQVCDMRKLEERFHAAFDWVVSFNALYEIVEDDGIRLALKGIYGALKPGGRAVFRLRDMDFVVDEEIPRHRVRRVWRIPGGQIINLVDWEYISDDELVNYEVYLREDEGFEPGEYGRWVSETIGARRKILRKAQLEAFLLEVGFEPVRFLLPPEPWMAYKVVATRPECAGAWRSSQ